MMKSTFTFFNHPQQSKQLQYATKLHLSKESHMEIFYKAYTKEINGTNYYFIKKYLTFPEYRNVPDILESYGMHKDFNRACRIALITDNNIREQLLNTLPVDRKRPKVIQMNVAKIISTAFKNTQHAIFKVKVASR